DPAEVRVYGATIRDEGRRLAEMIEQVLEFAGIASRERRRAREPVALASVVEEALKACGWAIAEASIEVELRVPSGLPAVMGDRARSGTGHTRGRGAPHLRGVLSGTAGPGGGSHRQWPRAQPGPAHRGGARRDGRGGERAQRGQRLHARAARPRPREIARGVGP